MRGTRPQHHAVKVRLGLIPTYAGNTACCWLWPPPRRAHPHVCGEHAATPWSQQASQGSSPRMRGTRACRNREAEYPGLIPTYAGNTRFLWLGVRASWAHPHVCGEHVIAKIWAKMLVGSSPRMRGTPGWMLFITWLVGLIPTYAGNTSLPP